MENFSERIAELRTTLQTLLSEAQKAYPDEEIVSDLKRADEYLSYAEEWEPDELDDEEDDEPKVA